MKKNNFVVKCWRGVFDSKEFYAEAESAAQLQKEIEVQMAFEISEGMNYTIKPL